MNRLTGTVQTLYPDGWKTSQQEKAENPDHELSPQELLNLHSKISVSDQGWLKLNLYNGTRYIVKELRIEFSLRDADHHEVWHRSYLLNKKTFGDVEPEQTIGDDQKWDWKIIGATGIPTARAPVDTPRPTDADEIAAVLVDPRFWNLPEDSQRVVMGECNWDFARLQPDEQRTWLKQHYKDFLQSKAKKQNHE
jgi:hypothetical protein